MSGGEQEWKRYSEGSIRLFDVLLLEDSSQRIFDALARIVGETLGCDRSLIYDVSFSNGHAEALPEWIDPSRPHITATKAVYPLAAFNLSSLLLRETREPLISHADAPHPTLVADGAAPLLHGGMKIQSLVWYPFLFREDGFFILAFNHVDRRHDWQDGEIEFMRTATRHVSMALVKVALIEQRARTEQAMFAAQKLESLGVLAGGVAHDFNNLMVGVVANAELVASKLPTDSSLRERVLAIQQAGERAAALASQLLAYAGKGSTELSLIEPRAALQAAAALVHASFPRIPIDVSGECPVPIECNRAQLDQVLMNLLVNAAEAMSDRAGAIRASCDVVDVDAEDAAAAGVEGAGRMVRFQIADDGPGMAPATIERIFDPFFTTKFAGRGLGLSAVQGIVRRHRGAIGVESAEGKGTTFTVLWPVAPAESIAAAQHATRKTTRTTSGKRVLAIDDEPLVLSAIRAILDDADCEVTTATGGTAGLAAWADGGADCYDVVLLDLTMPAPSGLDVLRTVRRDRPRMPIVVMSGYTEDPEVVRLLDDRTRFLRKPFTVEGLVDALSAVVVQRT